MKPSRSPETEQSSGIDVTVCGTFRPGSPAVTAASRFGKGAWQNRTGNSADIALIFLSFSDEDHEIAELLARRSGFSRSLVIAPWGMEAVAESTLIHSPLYSEFLEQTRALKYQRLLQWPYGYAALPWVADEDVLRECARWIEVPWVGQQRIQGPEHLAAADIEENLSKGLQDLLNAKNFLRCKFALMDRDGDGRLSREELVAHLTRVGISRAEALRCFELAGGEDITLEVFSHGQEELLRSELSRQDPRVHLSRTPIPQTADFFLSRGHSFAVGRRALSHFVEPSEPDAGLLIQGQTRFGDWARANAPEFLALQILPTEGLVVGHMGRIGDQDAYFSRMRKINGKEMISERTTDFSVVRMKWLPEDSGEVLTYRKPGIERSLTMKDGVLTGLSIGGVWAGFAQAVEYFSLGTPLPHWLQALFRETGEFQLEQATTRAPGDVVCTCTGVTCERIQQACDRGAKTVAQLAERTGASTVCGGCKTLLEEFVGSPHLHHAELITKQALGAGVFRLTFRPVLKPINPSLGGQHILIQGRIGDRWVTRAYTLSSGGTSSDVYEICVKREESGEFSRWLADTATSESLFRVSDPRGEFTVSDTGKRIVFFAGGIGVTPAVALMRSLDNNSRSVAFSLHWSAHREGGFVFREELEALRLRHADWKLTLRATGQEGRLSDVEIAAFCGPPTEATEIFLCGPGPFMESIGKAILENGWPESSLRVEHFGSKRNEHGHVRSLPQPELRSKGRVIVIEQESGSLEPVVSLEEEAKAFLGQYYEEQGLASVFPARWKDVQRAIQSTGSYEHTRDELSYGANLAWRNSNRCLGRKFWKNLALRDMRHLETEEEMFDAVLDHIRVATNNGDLRPTITVFKPDGRRIWNPQYFRYAGYRETDGSILGDPANAGLTDAALRLGWKREDRTRFDYLPLIVQIPDHEPKWFEIPNALILEVPIVHPDYPWFEDLNLKWYGLPAVSNMAFDVGGIQYLAAPFNGFYMETEIGARNFGDGDRYNLLPIVAEKLGMDIEGKTNLWKDRAVVEMNVAVLHSFSKRGVRMLDHHTLTQSFMDFMGEERLCGRTVQADRDYMVPPISGSLTPTFHAKFDGNRHLKPGFFYQTNPWDEPGGLASKLPLRENAKCPFHGAVD
jgi:nitric-oxide synthase